MDYATGTIECVQLDTDEYLWRWHDGDQIALTKDLFEKSPFFSKTRGNKDRWTFGPFKLDREQEWEEPGVGPMIGFKVATYRATKKHAVERWQGRQLTLSGGE